MLITALILAALILFLLFEYRVKTPDQLILRERKGLVLARTTRFYPRHFSLALPAVVYSSKPEYTAESKSRLPLRFKLALSVAPAGDQLTRLVRVGGWNREAVEKAAAELHVLLLGRVRAFAETHELEELSSEKASGQLNEKGRQDAVSLGLEIVNLSVQSIDPVDPEISKALQQRETARLMEESEKTTQNARIAAVRARVAAEKDIARMEHELVLHRQALAEKEAEAQARLDLQQTRDELERRRLKLEFENQEAEIFRNNPELLLLSPQLTQLAEASQQLKNARTVVSLSDPTGQPLAEVLLGLVDKLLPKSSSKDKS
jgi:hypothetical protein